MSNWEIRKTAKECATVHQYIHQRNKTGHKMKIELDMARKLAWSFHKSTNIDYDDLYGEALLGYAMAVDAAEVRGTYDPEKSAFTSFAWMCMNHHLCSVIHQRKYKSIGSMELDPKILDYRLPSPDRKLAFKDFLSHLSEEARFVVEMVLKSPVDFLELGRQRGRRKLKGALRDRGMNEQEAIRTLKDIKKSLYTIS